MDQKINREKLQTAAEMCREMARAFDEAANGEAFTRACANEGLNWSSCRMLVLSKTFQRCACPSVDLANAVELTKDPYENLYTEVFPDWNPETMTLPFDYVESAISVLGALTDREQKVVCMRCGIDEDDGRQRNYDEIAAEFGVTRERVRQIYIKALRKLRYPTRARILTKGLLQYQSDKAIAEAERQAWENAVQEETARRIANAQEKAEENIEKNGVQVKSLDTELPTDELSVRSNNCLWRAGIRTYEDLIRFPDENLCKIRNLGYKSLEEVQRFRDKILKEISENGAEEESHD